MDDSKSDIKKSENILTIEFKCSFCNQSHKAPSDMIGQIVDCPKCKNKVVISPDNDSSISGKVIKSLKKHRLKATVIVVVLVICISLVMVYINERHKEKVRTEIATEELRRSEEETRQRNEQYKKDLEEMQQKYAAEIARETAEKRKLTSWSYLDFEDEMTGKKIKIAELKSINEINLDFPYSGNQRVSLILRKHPRKGRVAYLNLEKGQFNRNGSSMIIRFDDGKSRRFSVNFPNDGSANSIFIENYDRFVTSLKKSSSMKIEVTFFQSGIRIFEFDTSGLDW